jgi:hypothetical protein
LGTDSAICHAAGIVAALQPGTAYRPSSGAASGAVTGFR